MIDGWAGRPGYPEGYRPARWPAGIDQAEATAVNAMGLLTASTALLHWKIAMWILTQNLRESRQCNG